LPLAGIVARRRALERADGNWLVDLASPADALTGMEADAAEHSGKGYFLSNNGQRLREFPFGGQTYVAGNIDSSRTSVGARNERSLALRSLDVAVKQGAGRTNLDAGAAELASGLPEGGSDRPGNDFPIPINKAQCADASKIPACPDAACTTYAQVVVQHEERLILHGGQVPVNVPRSIGRDSDVLGNRLQFAVA
jgi:hypothetical protein